MASMLIVLALVAAVGAGNPGGVAATQFVEGDPVGLRSTLFYDQIQRLQNAGMEQYGILDMANNPQLPFADTDRCHREFLEEPLDTSLSFRNALCWSSRFWAQGIAGSGESRWGEVRPRNLVIVSWHSEGEKETGQISVVDIDARAFRNVELVTPDLQPLETHAGGLAWTGKYLYLADTHAIYAFNLEHFFRDPMDDVIKLVAGEKWEKINSDFRISTLSATWGAGTGSLVAANYNSTAGSTVNVYQWPLNEEERLLADGSGIARSHVHFMAQGVSHVQGVENIGSFYLFTESANDRLVTVDYRNSASLAYQLPHYNTQDLYWDEDRGVIWSLTEGPAAERNEAPLAAGQTDRNDQGSWLTYLFAFSFR